MHWSGLVARPTRLVYLHIYEKRGVVLVNKHALCKKTFPSSTKCCLKKQNQIQSLTIIYHHLEPLRITYMSLTSIYEMATLKANLIKYKYIANHL